MADQISTPCIGICKIDQHTKVCRGCSRTVEQITNWSKMAEDERKRIMDELFYGD
jgi:predicted Fe-S protein YdhL (DUF1289 family)